MADPARAQPAGEAHDLRFVIVPLNFTRAEALVFTGWSSKLFDMFEREGSITGRPHGRNGQKIYSREELEAADRRRTGAAPAANDDGLDGQI